MSHLTNRAKLIRTMHDKGLSYEQIGDIFGISRQAAQQASYAGNGLRWKTINKIKYVGLRNWMIKNEVNVAELERRCNNLRMMASLTGGCDPSKTTIDAILKATGLTYEECFKEDDGNDQN